MNNIIQDYKELLSLTKTLILSEFIQESSLVTDQTAIFFKNFTTQKPANKANPIPPNELPPKATQAAATQNFQTRAPILKKTSPPVVEPPLSRDQKVVESLPPSSVYSKNKNSPILKLEPITEPKEVDYSSLKADFSNLFPNLALQNSIPDDSEARKISQQWKNPPATPQVILLFFDETPDQKIFLQKVTEAITQRLAPASLLSAYTIEKQNKWENMFKMQGIKLIIAPNYGIQLFPNLARHYRELQKTLGTIPILLLTDISLYLKQPPLKAALWRAICSTFDKNV